MASAAVNWVVRAGKTPRHWMLDMLFESAG